MRRLLSALLLLLPAPAWAEVPKIVTDIPPVQALVSLVMGDLGQPVLLLAKGADEHDFQLRPSQMGAIADADLIVWIGPRLTPWLDRASAGRPSLPLLDAPGTRLQPFASADDEGHGQGDTDPHAWLDPDNAKIWLGVIANALSSLDSDHAATYHANATAATDRIAAMDRELQASLAPYASTGFVTFHAAYGYFASHYGLTHSAALALGDAAAPGAARVAALQKAMRAGDYVCAFPEVQHSPALLAQVMESSPTRLGAPLDPVGSSLPTGPDAYEGLMRTIAGSLTDCLKG